jgi:hypothetical protein
LSSFSGGGGGLSEFRAFMVECGLHAKKIYVKAGSSRTIMYLFFSPDPLIFPVMPGVEGVLNENFYQVKKKACIFL